jgi:dihydrofolate reductase
MAVSLNSMAARESGAEDFLSNDDWELFVELLSGTEALIWGRVTHELFIEPVRQLFAKLPIAVLTRDPAFPVDVNTVRAASPATALSELAARGITHALLAGGPKVNGDFARERLIDEVIVAVEPVLVARGIPLLVGEAPDLRLDLVGIDDSRRPTVRLHYRVAAAA